MTMFAWVVAIGVIAAMLWGAWHLLRAMLRTLDLWIWAARRTKLHFRNDRRYYTHRYGQAQNRRVERRIIEHSIDHFGGDSLDPL